MIRLANPSFLLLLILIIPVLFLSTRAGGRIRFSSIAVFKKMKTVGRWHPRQILTLLRVSALILFVFALCRPQSGRMFTQTVSEGVDIFLALDTSKSMEAMDFKEEEKPVHRLHVVKGVVADFIRKRPVDRLGLVIFGTEAFTQCPLTLDHGVVMDFLEKTEIAMAGEGTAIGQAIGTAVKRMKDLKSKSKIIILLTDGRSNSGQIPPLKASELAETFGIKIYTIGVGTRGKAPFLVDTFFGKRYVYQDVDIDEETLQSIANQTGGKYYRATDKNELEKIYDEIDKLERTKIEVKEYTEYNELFLWFLIPALLLLLIEIVLGNTRLRKIP